MAVLAKLNSHETLAAGAMANFVIAVDKSGHYTQRYMKTAV